jgi:ATP-dependent RNA helicase DeaD
MKMEQFSKLGINKEVLISIEKQGFTEPTEIQEKSIPLVMQGKDVIASAATGSGKTLSFASGIIQNCKKGYGVQALVLAPTRELAEQISRELRKFANNTLKIIAVYGGVAINPQMDDLEDSEIVIGTPGRILDHLSRDTINLSKVKILVLDEADRMLDMGFKEDVEKIIKYCPKNRQTLLYSATISQDIALLGIKYMKDPAEVSAEAYVDETKLSQFFYDVPDNLKFSLLVHLLENENAKLVMVFCNTRRNVDFVANNLRLNQIDVLPIHGGYSQGKRNIIMEQFHSQNVRVLVCTDVAARGLDIKGVTHVYNYDIPKDSKDYIHRIGRTARAGKEGKIINILSGRDYENFRQVLKDDSLKISPLVLPELKTVRVALNNRSPRQRYNNRNNNFSGNRRSNSKKEFGRTRYHSRDSRSDDRNDNSRYNNMSDRNNRQRRDFSKRPHNRSPRY